MARDPVRRRNFKEKTVFIYNPLPDITTEEVIEKAGLGDILDRADPPFLLKWQYGSGDEMEHINLHPGEALQMKESEAMLFISEKAEEGGVTVNDMDNAEEVQAAALKGLRRAREFWQFRGTKQLVNIRKNLEIGKDELEDYRVDHWRIYYNEALKDCCLEAIQKLTNKPEKTSGRVPRTKKEVA